MGAKTILGVFIVDENISSVLIFIVALVLAFIYQPKRVKSLNLVIFVSHPYIFKKKSSFSAL